MFKHGHGRLPLECASPAARRAAVPRLGRGVPPPPAPGPDLPFQRLRKSTRPLPSSSQQTSMLLTERWKAFTPCTGLPQLCLPGEGMALGVEVSRGRGHLSHLARGSGSALPAPHPQGGPEKPCIVFKTSQQKSLCLPSALSGLLPLLSFRNPSARVGVRLYMPDRKDRPPGQWDSGTAEASKAQRRQMLEVRRHLGGCAGPWGQTRGSKCSLTKPWGNPASLSFIPSSVKWRQ